MENSPEKMNAKIVLIEATPTLSHEQFILLTKNTNAVIFVVFASGSSPDRLNNAIKEKTEENVPVFLVSNNRGDTHGILKTIYDAQVGAITAGAIPIEKINVNNIQELSHAIQQEFLKGKKGSDLGSAIQEKFSYKIEENKPLPSWENPEEIAKQRELYGNTLKRMNLSGEETEKELKKWEGNNQ